MLYVIVVFEYDKVTVHGPFGSRRDGNAYAKKLGIPGNHIHYHIVRELKRAAL